MFSGTQQMAPHPAMQQGAFYMQHPQAAMAMAQQPGVFSPKMPMQFANPHQMQELQQQMHQHQQSLQGQMGIRPVGINNGVHALQAETSAGGPSAPVPNDQRGGSKQDAPEAATAGADGQGTSGAGNGGADGSDEGK